MEHYDIIERTDKAESQEQQLFLDSCSIIEQAQSTAYRSVNETLIKRNWLLGMRSQHEILKERRAEYGEQVIKTLSKALTERYGKGFNKTNLYLYTCFYRLWPDIFHAVSEKSENVLDSIVTCAPIRLSWSHYRIILQEPNSEARAWYEREATREMWSTRTLQRNVSSQYYHRLLKSQDKTLVRDEMKALTQPLQDKLEYLKNPVIAEFLGFKNNTNYTESNLEQSIYYVTVDVEFAGRKVRLFFTKRNRNSDWNALITTNTVLEFKDAYRIYSKRWSLEVVFKDSKGNIGLGKY